MKVNWLITNFPSADAKARFMGQCMKEGKDWKVVLANLMKSYVSKMEEGIRGKTHATK